MKTFSVSCDVSPIVWRAVRLVQSGCRKQVVFAGGYLRDCYYGKAPKDIDIFVPHPFDESVFDRSVWERKSWVAGDFQVADSEYEAYFRNSVVNVFEFSTTDFGFPSVPINVIVLDRQVDLHTVLGSSDFGINQIGWESNAYARATHQFLADYENETATCIRPANDPRMGRVEDRARRLAEKFPTKRWLFPTDLSKQKMAPTGDAYLDGVFDTL